MKEIAIENLLKLVQIFFADCLEVFDMPPTEKQIKFVELITTELGIDFPQSSEEFTKKTYFEFIKEHYDELKDKAEWQSWDEDEMDWFQMLNG